MNEPRMNSLASRLGELLKEVDQLLESGAAKAGEAPDAAIDGLHRAREHLRRAGDELRGRARAIDRAVHENPWKAIAATGLVAFLLGLLARRR
jgi:ElaB/YqjD/DUF883 family membrane-anchored ribosome-binding protein